jgi:hypothetical protein
MIQGKQTTNRILEEDEAMEDLIFIAATVGFFFISVAYTYACGRL